MGKQLLQEILIFANTSQKIFPNLKQMTEAIGKILTIYKQIRIRKTLNQNLFVMTVEKYL